MDSTLMIRKKSRCCSYTKISAGELIEQDLSDLVIERSSLTILQDSAVVDSIQIFNGLKEGNLTRALNGEHAGTIIYTEKK